MKKAPIKTTIREKVAKLGASGVKSLQKFSNADPIHKEEDITISVDLMGSDNAPEDAIFGVEESLVKHKHVSFILFGDKAEVERIRPEFDFENPRCKFVHTDKKILSTQTLREAVKNSAQTSMKLAIESVKKKESDAIVSSGNTGALMGLSKILLRTLDGIDRPAICCTIPSFKTPVVMLDVGANIDCSSKNLFQFSVMGSAFFSAIYGKANPTLGLLNIGEEESKGGTVINEAAEMIKSSELSNDFKGYIEPDKILQGNVDVVVQDGFIGNIFIKACEGTLSFVSHKVKKSIKRDWLLKILFLIGKVFVSKKKLEEFDRRNYNGAMIMGLNGICVKSHGGADGVGFAKALDVAIMLVKEEVNQKISTGVHSLLKQNKAKKDA